MRQKLVLAVSGKGGVGKTSVTALLIRTLLKYTTRSLLIVDADPVMNLPKTLGIDVARTVGDAATQLRRSIDAGTLGHSISKQDLLEGEVYEALVEGTKFDFLAMGRTEGEGCYCYVNRILSQILDILAKNYDITIMDMSAGLEHLSRRTTRDVDVLVIVIDPSRMAFDAAIRIRNLAKEVQIDFKRIFVIANCFPASLIEEVSEDLTCRLADEGLELVGFVPADDELTAMNLRGKPLLELPDSSLAVKAVEAIAKKLGLLGDSTFLELLRPAT
ncbi:MAG: AAA family ATPase [Promethearchaeota archaeon]